MLQLRALLHVSVRKSATDSPLITRRFTYGRAQQSGSKYLEILEVV